MINKSTPSDTKQKHGDASGQCKQHRTTATRTRTLANAGKMHKTQPVAFGHHSSHILEGDSDVRGTFL